MRSLSGPTKSGSRGQRKPSRAPRGPRRTHTCSHRFTNDSTHFTEPWESDVIQRRSKVTPECVDCLKQNRGFVFECSIYHYSVPTVSGVPRCVSTRSPAPLRVETNTTRWFLLYMSSTNQHVLMRNGVGLSHIIRTRETSDRSAVTSAAFFRHQADSWRFPAVCALLLFDLLLQQHPQQAFEGFCLHQHLQELDVDFSRELI